MTSENREKYLSGLRSALVEFERPSSQAAWRLPAQTTPADFSDSECRVKKPNCAGAPKNPGARRSCLYAGNLSRQDRGPCRPVKSFTPSRGDSSWQCPAGQVICNPLVFGVAAIPKDSTVIPTPQCVPMGPDATELCHKKSPANAAGKFLEAPLSGIQNAWDEWKNNLRALCEKDSRFHCKECGLIMERLFALKTEIRGNLCKDLPGYLERTPSFDH